MLWHSSPNPVCIANGSATFHWKILTGLAKIFIFDTGVCLCAWEVVFCCRPHFPVMCQHDKQCQFSTATHLIANQQFPPNLCNDFFLTVCRSNISHGAKWIMTDGKGHTLISQSPFATSVIQTYSNSWTLKAFLHWRCQFLDTKSMKLLS